MLPSEWIRTVILSDMTFYSINSYLVLKMEDFILPTRAYKRPEGMSQEESNSETIVREASQAILSSLGLHASSEKMDQLMSQAFRPEEYDIPAHAEKYRALLDIWSQGGSVVYTERSNGS